MAEYRSFVVWGASIVVLLGAFLVFVAAGWPGEPNGCIDDEPNTCYCESFVEKDVRDGAPGVRQKVNTWFNLYSIVTSLIVAFVVYQDRRSPVADDPPNLMRGKTWVPDLYVFAVLFLGLGSMWFHGSLTEWGGILDGTSMYVYAAFLTFYSVRRFWDSAAFFWIGYVLTVLGFTLLALALPSVVNIIILVVAYVAVEVSIWVRTGKVMLGTPETVLLWVFAVVCILSATLFWVLSQTGGALCDPESFFQPHGLLWHPLAGVMAVLLFFYWRSADDRAA